MPYNFLTLAAWARLEDVVAADATSLRAASRGSPGARGDAWRGHMDHRRPCLCLLIEAIDVPDVAACTGSTRGLRNAPRFHSFAVEPRTRLSKMTILLGS